MRDRLTHSIFALLISAGFVLELEPSFAFAQKTIVAPDGMDVGIPFSPGVLSGDFLYLAGSIGNEPGTLNVPDGIEAQVRKTFENLKTVLEAADMDFSRVVSVNVFLSDARHFQTMNEIYRTYFPNDPPIRATVEADIAIPGALVEIAMIAARPGVERRVIRPQTMKSPALPYSWGILAGDTLFVAGATARDPDTYEPAGGDMKAQTRRVLQNVGLVLEAAGMDYTDVVNCQVFLDDARLFQDMNEVYRTFFPEEPPTRATVRTKLMNSRFLSEIQCTAVDSDSRRVVSATDARSSSPFSPALQVGERLFVSGMVGRGPNGYAPGDASAQTRQTLENIRATLAAADMDFDDIVNVMVYVSDIRYFQAMNEVYREMMPTPPPARATVGAPLMSPDALVEIMVLAVKNENE
jgi:2-iminobutanoate/2-iminopropanoate deaminase